jgi:glycosyltransferase involved in cell wall biosynthesis
VKPVRVLHVVGAMSRAGIETWLMGLLRQADRSRLRMDFLVHTHEPAHYDEEILDLGGRIFRVDAPKRSARYPAALRRALAQAGPADVLHSHEHYLSGFILASARRNEYGLRIAHSHNDTSGREGFGHPLRSAYAIAMRALILRHADLCLAASERAAPCLFGRNWRARTNVRLLYYGLDFEAFRLTGDRREFRRRLGLPPDATVVAHVGRFEWQKNHTLIVETSRWLKQNGGPFHFLLVGEGSLRPQVEQRVREAGLESMFTITGSRADVPELLCLAADVFLFPSWHEGLGLALVEAQAAGLPTVHSRTIPEEANLFPSENIRLAPEAAAAEWGAALIRAASQPRPSSAARLEQLTRSRFSLARSFAELEALYLARDASQFPKCIREQAMK